MPIIKPCISIAMDMKAMV